MAACPMGHDSADDNFCDVCGQRIGGDPPGQLRTKGRHRGSPLDAANGEPKPRSQPSGPPEWLFPPESKVQSPPWGRMESPSSAPPAAYTPYAPPARSAPPAATFSPASSAPPTMPTPKFTPARWTVLVSADRAYYDRMRASHVQASTDVEFPAHTAERRILLTGHQLRIGRRSAVRELEPEIDLAEPPVDPGISRLHAMLIAAPDGTWSVLDPGSANGTLLNGREISVGDLNPLREGDRINLGAWTVISVHRA